MSSSCIQNDVRSLKQKCNNRRCEYCSTIQGSVEAEELFWEVFLNKWHYLYYSFYHMPGLAQCTVMKFWQPFKLPYQGANDVPREENTSSISKNKAFEANAHVLSHCKRSSCSLAFPFFFDLSHDVYNSILSAILPKSVFTLLSRCHWNQVCRTS